MAKRNSTGKDAYKDVTCNASTANEIFKSFSVDKLFFTGDGLAFFSLKEAEQHAKSLKNSEITEVNNSTVQN